MIENNGISARIGFIWNFYPLNRYWAWRDGCQTWSIHSYWDWIRSNNYISTTCSKTDTIRSANSI